MENVSPSLYGKLFSTISQHFETGCLSPAIVPVLCRSNKIDVHLGVGCGGLPHLVTTTLSGWQFGAARTLVQRNGKKRLWLQARIGNLIGCRTGLGYQLTVREEA